ncbi:MAG: cbb3-type cytochrome oxidase assembly protein CcoS [Planctomycetota bacterium]|nr:MAG: cbb3-type cytochrome oxidase assembly protein CcoS [Planctomycetota bacterium]
MSLLYVALPVAVLLGAAGLWACLYCIRDGQFDDLDTPPLRMLNDDLPLRTGSSAPGHGREEPPS